MTTKDFVEKLLAETETERLEAIKKHDFGKSYILRGKIEAYKEVLRFLEKESKRDA